MKRIEELNPNDFIFVEDKTIDRRLTLYKVSTFIRSAQEYPEDYGKVFEASKTYPIFGLGEFSNIFNSIIRPHLEKDRNYISRQECDELPPLLTDEVIEKLYLEFKSAVSCSGRFRVVTDEEVDWSSILKTENKFTSLPAFKLMMDGKTIQKIGPCDTFYTIADVKPLNGMEPFQKVLISFSPQTPGSWKAYCNPNEFVKLMEYETFRLWESAGE